MIASVHWTWWCFFSISLSFSLRFVDRFFSCSFFFFWRFSDLVQLAELSNKVVSRMCGTKRCILWRVTVRCARRSCFCMYGWLCAYGNAGYIQRLIYCGLNESRCEARSMRFTSLSMRFNSSARNFVASSLFAKDSRRRSINARKQNVRVADLNFRSLVRRQRRHDRRTADREWQKWLAKYAFYELVFLWSFLFSAQT